MKKYQKPNLQKLNPQDLVDKERSFLRFIKGGILQILALLPGKDSISQEELKKLHNTILQAITMLSNIYKMELKIVPADAEIIKSNIAIIDKVESLFKERKYISINRLGLLNKLQS